MIKTFFTFLLLFAGVSLVACSDTADEMAIQITMQAMREAIKKHDPQAFMSHVSKDYRGQYHGTYGVFEEFVGRQLKNNKTIYIYMADTRIQIKDGIAKVIFYAGTAGGPDQVPERGQLFKVQTNWRPFDGRWQLTHARWRPALEFPEAAQ